MVSVILVIIAFITALAGVAGCILPVIPGPLLGWLALIIMYLAVDGQPFSATFLVLMAGLAILLTLLDYLVSIAGAKKFGASRAGIWGSVLGMIIGLIFFPPLGLFIGALAGAVVAEIAVGKRTGEALRVGWGVVVGTFVGTALKLAYCFMTLIFLVGAMMM